MTYQNEFTLSEALLGQLTADGLEALPTLFQVLLNAAVQIERLKHLGVALHERTEQRTGHAAGYKGETLPSRRVSVFSLSAAEASPEHREPLCQPLEIGGARVTAWRHQFLPAIHCSFL